MRDRSVSVLLALIVGVVTHSAIGSPPAATEALKIRVAAISFVPTKLDVAGNADRLEAAFRKAGAGGAKLAVAPEGALDGYVINQVLNTEVPVERLKAVALELEHPIIRRFQALAKELRLCLVFGLAERVGSDIFNTALFIDGEGLIRGKYHKMQFEEGYHPDWWFNRLGATSRAFDTPFGRCGILICNDRWNPALARIPALDGAQFLIIPAFGSTSHSQDAAVLSRARETGLPKLDHSSTSTGLSHSSPIYSSIMACNLRLVLSCLAENTSRSSGAMIARISTSEAAASKAMARGAAAANASPPLCMIRLPVPMKAWTSASFLTVNSFMGRTSLVRAGVYRIYFTIGRSSASQDGAL